MLGVTVSTGWKRNTEEARWERWIPPKSYFQNISLKKWRLTKMTSVWKKYSYSEGLNLWRSESSHQDRTTGKHTHTHSWTVTQGQSCELCPTVTMAMRDPSQGSSCAVRSPKAKDVPMNSVIVVSPNPSCFSISRCHLSSLSLSFPFPFHFLYLISCVLVVFK